MTRRSPGGVLETRSADRYAPSVAPAASAAGSSIPAALWLESPYLARAVRRVALRYSLNDDDAEDLVQELRMVLLGTEPHRFLNATWIFQTASHKASDVVRRRIRRSEGESVGMACPPPSSPPELLHLLRAKASHLPPRLKAFYDLRFGEGLSQRDVARRLGACRASVRWLERQCLRLIR